MVADVICRINLGPVAYLRKKLRKRSNAQTNQVTIAGSSIGREKNRPARRYQIRMTR